MTARAEHLGRALRSRARSLDSAARLLLLAN